MVEDDLISHDLTDRYVSKGRDEEARKALQWLRGKQADVDPELKGIIKTHTDAERQSSSNGLRQLLRRSNLKPLAISLGLMFFQQFSGINAVIFYAQDIFNGGKTEAEIERIKAEGGDSSTIVLGVVNFIATFVATVLIDRLGRKVTNRIGNVVMSTSDAFISLLLFLFPFQGFVVHFVSGHDRIDGNIGRILLQKRFR